MRCLLARRHDYQRNEAMKKLDAAGMTKLRTPSCTPELAAGTAAEPLEVNVIFTDLDATAAALKAAEKFACELHAHICLRAGLVVPLQLPLDRPQISVEFLERALQNLIHRSQADRLERTAHIYICRDWIDTLSDLLKADSIVVIGLRKHWWPTSASRLARTLRAYHNRVIVIDTKGLPKESQKQAAMGKCN